VTKFDTNLNEFGSNTHHREPGVYLHEIEICFDQNEIEPDRCRIEWRLIFALYIFSWINLAFCVKL